MPSTHRNPGTALVTGASSGIGAAYARKLASRGHGVMLVARRRDRLESLASELREEFAVDAEVVVADLADAGDLERLEGRIRERADLEFLVNNAGFGTGGRFRSVGLEKNLDMLRVHCEATVRLTHAALAVMMGSRRGFVVNVSSVAGIVRLPGSTMYCSTKAFLNAFSETLAMEMRGTGVRIQALCPGFTYTEFHDSPELANRFDRSDVPRFLWLSADRVVEMSLSALRRDRVICVTGVWYKLLVAVSQTRVLRPLLRRLSRKRERGAGGNGKGGRGVNHSRGRPI